MAIGESGRLVIEIDANDKRAIHDNLRQRGLSLKAWLLKKAEEDGLIERHTPSDDPGNPDNGGTRG